MPDIRDRIEEDRGWIKRIQLHIPGYAGYRRREDLRGADKILRTQLAEKLKTIREDVENVRGYMTSKYIRDNLEQLGNLILDFQEVEGKLRHSAGGYTGFSPMIRIEEDEIERLYEFDYSMVTVLDAIAQGVPPLDAAVKAGDINAASMTISTVKGKLDELDKTFRKRLQVITGTEVVK